MKRPIPPKLWQYRKIWIIATIALLTLSMIVGFFSITIMTLVALACLSSYMLYKSHDYLEDAWIFCAFPGEDITSVRIWQERYGTFTYPWFHPQAFAQQMDWMARVLSYHDPQTRSVMIRGFLEGRPQPNIYFRLALEASTPEEQKAYQRYCEEYFEAMRLPASQESLHFSYLSKTKTSFKVS